MWRALIFLVMSSVPAQAWDAWVEDGLCVLEHEAPDVHLRLTYDPSLPLYTIALKKPLPWPEAPIFSIRFEGARGLTISTQRHQLAEDGRRLSVSDTGFGNVLDGLAQNESAVAIAGSDQISVDLDGALPAVAAFRSCTTAPLA